MPNPTTLHHDQRYPQTAPSFTRRAAAAKATFLEQARAKATQTLMVYKTADLVYHSSIDNPQNGFSQLISGSQRMARMDRGLHPQARTRQSSLLRGQKPFYQ